MIVWRRSSCLAKKLEEKVSPKTVDRAAVFQEMGSVWISECFAFIKSTISVVLSRLPWTSCRAAFDHKGVRHISAIQSSATKKEAPTSGLEKSSG
jgi:hypothetical protein